MSQNAPRKFSEKIAILERKQNEEKELFHNVMREVQAITSVKRPLNPGPEQGVIERDCIRGNGIPVCDTIGALMPDPNTLSLNWNRSGGSLPNVHAIAQQPATNWNYWQTPTTTNSNIRRSPGHHSYYHPYLTNDGRGISPNKHQEKIIRMDGTQMGQSNMHLQLPNPSWSKARSDPAIHSNIVNQSFDISNQFPTQIPQNQLWPTPNFRSNQPINLHSPPAPMPFFLGYGNNSSGAVYSPQFPSLNQIQHSSPPSSSNTYNHPNSNSIPFATDLSVGSLPNMHSTFAQLKSQGKSIIMPTTFDQGQPYPTTASVDRPDIIRQTISQQHQLSTPMIFTQSQSAPTSPAQTAELQLQQQWPSTRHFSASPDVMEVPNICITGADGNENLDCFQDLQDLHLDNEIQRLLRDPNDGQVDPIAENQLLS